MTVVLITAHLLSGIEYIPGEVLSLDGPLLYAAVRDRMGDGFHATRPSNEELARLTAEPDPGVPLSVARAPGTWVYQISGGVLTGVHGSTRHHWHTRLDDGMLVNAVMDGTVDMGRATKITTAAGPYRAVRMPVDTVLAEAVEWIAVSPDPEELTRALRSIRHIGKGRNAGGGVVLRWEIETFPDSSTMRWMQTEEGDLTRPLPLALVEGVGPLRAGRGAFPGIRAGQEHEQWNGPTAWAPVRPPYWLVQHQEWCAMPKGGGEP